MIELLLVVLLVVILLGVIYWVAGQFFPHPWPLAIVAIVAIVLALALVGETGDIDIGNGR